MKTAEELFLYKYGNKITASESWVIRFAEEYASQFKADNQDKWISDKEIEGRALNVGESSWKFDSFSYEEGAKWMRDKLLPPNPPKDK